MIDDLHKVTFPTFVLEPRSMLEHITDFMSNPNFLFGHAPSTNHLPKILCADLVLFCPSDCLSHLCALLSLSTTTTTTMSRLAAQCGAV